MAQRMVRRRLLAIAAAGAIAGATLPVASHVMAQAPKQDDPWPGLVSDVFHDQKMSTDASVIALTAPARAEDAAVVPMIIHLGENAGHGAKIAKVTLVIDGNPAPVAAVFSLGQKSEVTMIETRVRVDQYTNVHAVAETTDGRLFVSTAFVKAAGGCSAPAGKDPEEAKANIGKMKLRLLPNADGGAAQREVELMIRHPNNSGMQMDQITHYYIPALYVNKVTVTQGDDLILAIDGGISISQDPNFRFTYAANGATTLHVAATDSSGKTFQKDWPINQAM